MEFLKLYALAFDGVTMVVKGVFFSRSSVLVGVASMAANLSAASLTRPPPFFSPFDGSERRSSMARVDVFVVT